MKKSKVPHVSSTVRVSVTIAFRGARGYIAEPYHPETARWIDIVKQSGMSRCRSDKTRRAALESHLQKLDMSLADFEALEIAAKDPWQRNADGHLVIPADRWLACLAHIAHDQPRAQRFCAPAQVRTSVLCTEPLVFEPYKAEGDGVWERMVMPKDGKGNPLSNQRSLRVSHFIEDVSASAVMRLDTGYVDTDSLRHALEWGGHQVGIGACRKMGWGRFTVESFEVS